jgi:cbb3-type cytochrome oxidase subunit 3
MVSLNEIVILSYFIFGVMFLFYSLAIAQQHTVPMTLRLFISTIAILLGFIFLNAATKILTEYNDILTTSTLIFSALLFIVFTAFVMWLYSNGHKKCENLEKCQEQKK